MCVDPRASDARSYREAAEVGGYASDTGEPRKDRASGFSALSGIKEPPPANVGGGWRFILFRNSWGRTS